MTEPWFTVVIPTRDSAAWIGVVLKHYRSRGVTPTIMLDTRTQDDTKAIAMRHGARIIDMPGFTYTERMVASTREFVTTPWVAFIHDDEMLSDAVFERLRGPQPEGVQTVAIPRRWAWYEPGKPLCYGRSGHWADRAGDNGADHGWRLFRPDQVTFISDMHSEGYLIDRWSRLPPHAYNVHFEWVLRTYEQRVAKLRRYDAHRFGHGDFFKNMYLPETQSPGVIEYIPFETDAFDELAQAYFAARGPNPKVTPLSVRERWSRLKMRLTTIAGVTGLNITPKDRRGLAPRPDAEVADIYDSKPL
jgi:hypothetical protein